MNSPPGGASARTATANVPDCIRPAVGPSQKPSVCLPVRRRRANGTTASQRQLPRQRPRALRPSGRGEADSPGRAYRRPNSLLSQVPASTNRRRTAIRGLSPFDPSSAHASCSSGSPLSPEPPATRRSRSARPSPRQPSSGGEASADQVMMVARYSWRTAAPASATARCKCLGCTKRGL